MSNERIFLTCESCGNIVGMIEVAVGIMECCGQVMSRIAANTVDAAKEKHLPVAKLGGSKLMVEVGSIPHPMDEKHHITWIAIAQGRMTQRFTLENTGSPTATFHGVENDEISVYAYCNLHGLWRTDVNGSVLDGKFHAPEFSE